MNYGYGVAGPNQAPVAVAVAKPRAAAVGEEITFSGLGSSDDRQMPDALAYEWDFNQDGTVDAEGATAQYAYTKAGTYRATSRSPIPRGSAERTSSASPFSNTLQFASHLTREAGHRPPASRVCGSRPDRAGRHVPCASH